MANYLVTGGCGFIGSHLCHALQKMNHKVVVLDNLSNGCQEKLPDGVSFVKGDISDSKLVGNLLEDADLCFHLAAIPVIAMPIESWVEYHTNNLSGTITILQEAIRHANVPVVYASSSAVYGDCQILPLNEKMNAMPFSAYGASKLACEMNAFVAKSIFKLPSIGLRFFNVYGPRQDPKSPYSGVITRCIQNFSHNMLVTIYGDGEQTRDFIYVDDIVNSLIKSAELISVSPLSTVINVCTGQQTSINTITNTIANLMKKPCNVKHDSARLCDARHSCGCTVSALKHGLEVKTNLISGLRKTINSFRPFYT